MTCGGNSTTFHGFRRPACWSLDYGEQARLARILLFRPSLNSTSFWQKNRKDPPARKSRPKPPRESPKSADARPSSSKKTHKAKVVAKAKRPRGRPRKLVSRDTPPTKRGRGRPPGKKSAVRLPSKAAISGHNGELAGTNGDSPPTSASNTQARIRELIKLAKEQGYLTFDDLNEALPPDLTDADELDLILMRLRKLEIDIIEASEVDRYKDVKKDPEEEEEKAGTEARHPRRSGADVSEADGPGAAADARAGSGNFQADRGSRRAGSPSMFIASALSRARTSSWRRSWSKAANASIA